MRRTGTLVVAAVVALCGIACSESMESIDASARDNGDVARSQNPPPTSPHSVQDARDGAAQKGPSSAAPDPSTAPQAKAPLPPIPAGLLESERNTIEVFRAAGDSVVFVTNTALRRDRFSTNVMEVPQGTGSGFVWDAFGHVVTNYHVVEGGAAFTITLSDGSMHDAQLVGAEPRKDLAVLHFDPAGVDLKAIPVGRSAELIVGQKVLAIGNPFGLDRTLTTGVISALGREIPAPGGFVIEDVIQADASINPGNSGGPLIDSAGRLIGVNTAIFSPTGTSAGIGFAIPADTVARIVPQLIRFGRVKRAGLGISVLPDHVMGRWGLTGVGVREVIGNSEAQRAGLQSLQLDRRGSVQVMDVIVAVGTDTVESFPDLANALDPYSPGDIVVVHFLRNGAPGEARVRLQELGN